MVHLTPILSLTAGVTQLSDAAQCQWCCRKHFSFCLSYFPLYLRSHPEDNANLKRLEGSCSWSGMHRMQHLVIGMNLPADRRSKTTWSYIAFAYIFLAAVLPIWLLMQPRDYMTTFMFAGMIIAAVVGLFGCTSVQ